MNYTTIDSPVGELLASADAAGRITGLHFYDGHRLPARDSSWVRDEEALVPLRCQLEEYFAGERTDFDVPMELDGTDFQRAVWSELARIPYGETISYGELARRVGRPKGPRAVGQANGRNPIPIIVPCHRVLASNGIGGYGGGLPMKPALLAVEGVTA